LDNNLEIYWRLGYNPWLRLVFFINELQIRK
jgi:hypothetical protein